MTMLALKGDAIKTADVHKDEIYPTPVSLVRAVVQEAIEQWVGGHIRRWKGAPNLSAPVRVLDLAAGSGVWGIVAKEELEKLGYTAYVVGIEKTIALDRPPEFDEWISAEFQLVTGLESFDLIFTNPPFSLAVEIGLFARALLDEDGKFYMLIGQNFGFAAEAHAPLFDVWSPEYEYKLTKRPGFFQPFAGRYNPRVVAKIQVATDEEEIKRLKKQLLGGGTNAKEYIVYRWGRDSGPRGEWLTRRFEWDYEDDPPFCWSVPLWSSQPWCGKRRCAISTIRGCQRLTITTRFSPRGSTCGTSTTPQTATVLRW
jgi:hypothetical protein